MIRDNISGYSSTGSRLRDPQRVIHAFGHYGPNHNSSAMEAYENRPMVKVEIDAIIAAEYCQEQLAPVIAAFESEKAKILGRA